MAEDSLTRREPPAIDLRRMTEARVQLGRFGAGLPTRAAQAFLLDHARAREAVWSVVDWDRLVERLADLPVGTVAVESAAHDRSTFVRRPDLGRKLSDRSSHCLAGMPRGSDVAIVVGDGLSASAIDLNAAPLIRAVIGRLQLHRLAVAPIVLASQARVALGDAVGEALGARISIVMIGERPGLSAADSLGVYITYGPKTGTPDSRRNCISNIRRGGLSIEAAAESVVALVLDMIRTETSGVALLTRR
ncbi:ethanolamine ammonia-lyase subunit EutC [Rhodopseudomonas sp. BR0M22]|uniref:ethanolamine ammonia-lyase subunit EutC n=1 Tax=Rhodopseudomonas sp. BR0M22 TaxID=2269369 RepID=UPI0013E0C476|nr:ethanolamine ammonia-lyase subunit EutC [Rhodopseudomonas sp. BR0M22]NEW94233.1 ethanolamine ammonia-lyase subunit EutC [Rhodopseudomonas sp. BR0M22]